MPRVRMFVQEWPSYYVVIFTEEHNSAIQLDRQFQYPDTTRIFDILRSARAPLETHRAVEYALASPPQQASVVLNLSPEQCCARLPAGMQSSHPKSKSDYSRSCNAPKSTGRCRPRGKLLSMSTF